MITIKISSRGSGKNLDISQYLGNAQGWWGDCFFSVNSDVRSADVWIVSEDVDDDDVECEVAEGGLIFVTAETSWPSGYYADHPERLKVLSQFDRVLTPHVVPLPNVTPSLPFLPWMINANHGPSINAPHVRDVNALETMSAPAKTRDLSVFCSTQSLTEGHRQRFHFVEKLKEHFGDRLDWYGNGVNSLPEKWDGIAPYRATIVLENRATPRVITEKLMDAYLGFAYPFYWGARDVRDHIPTTALTPIDIQDLVGSIEVIERQLADGTPERAASAIADIRPWILREWNPYARMAALGTEVVANSGGRRQKRRLRTMASAQAASRGGFWARLLGH